MKSCVFNVLTYCPVAEKIFARSKGRKPVCFFQNFFLAIAFVAINLLSSTGIDAQIVTTHLYLSDPAQALDRVDPVATADATTATSNRLYQSVPGIVINNTTTGYSANPGSVTFTVSHTTGSENNRLMLVGISQKNKIVNSVTYGGVQLNLVGESISNGNAHMHIYSMVNPPSGTANVVVTLNANPDKGIAVGVTTFSNVNQTTPLGTFASATAKTIAATVTVSSATGELVFDVATYRNRTMTVASGQTAFYNINTGGEVDGGGSSTKPGATSVTMTWNGAESEDWAIGAVPIKPAPLVNTATFVQTPSLCSGITIKSGNTITVTNYLTSITGTMPANPNITALLKYGATNIITLTNPTYNSGTGLLTWTGTLGADVSVPASQAISLEITNLQSATSFLIQFDSQTKPSKISLPLSTYINVNSVNVYSAAYPGGSIVTTGVGGATKYLRAVVSNPFGYTDITSLNFVITPTGSSVAGTLVSSAGCTRTYEYVWAVPASATTYSIDATAKQGYENTVTHTNSTSYTTCVLCPPVAVTDLATGNGGSPLTIDALANDYDPNNNINTASLAILTQPNNGSAFLSNGNIVYLPNGTYSGNDTIHYTICDNTSLCATGQIIVTINVLFYDPCANATLTHTYYLPYPEDQARIALQASSSSSLPSNNIQTIISITVPYPGMNIIWDEWEDGYESNPLKPLQSTTKVWGDGNIYNGTAPGYPNDIIPAGGSIILDNTMPANPRISSNIFYDGRDRVTSSGQIAMTQICGEPTNMPVQAIKTNVTSTYNYGQSFTVPLGQNYPSRDFQYTALFIRAEQDNTNVSIDKDNNGTFETTTTLNQGQSYLLNGGVYYGASVATNKPVGVELNAGGVDGWSIRNATIYPATWYSHTYYSPVPTSDNAGDSPKDSSVVMLYNSLNRAITINWSSGIPSNGSINLPAKGCVRFPLAYSTTAAYKFVNPTGESFTAIEIVDSYTPGGGGNDGQTYDWSFNLVAESRLTDFATTAWAPGGLDLVAPPGPDVNGNPVWVTPNANTTIYVKYDGNISGSTGSTSPCGLKYDVSYTLNALNYIKILDPTDNDQSGLAIYTCDGSKIAAVYGADPRGSGTGLGVAYWDVGTTIQSFCKQKLIFANDDYAKTMVNQPVTISILNNDWGFLATIDPASVSNTGLLQPSNGTVTINANGTVLYTPNAGFTGLDTFEYRVCSTPSPIVCDNAKVYVEIAACPASPGKNLVSGKVFLDSNKDGLNNDTGAGVAGVKVYLYIDGNCNGIYDTYESADSLIVDSSGTYQFEHYPEKIVSDNFDGAGGVRTCADGSDGNALWLTDWVDAGDPSSGFCNTSQSAGNTDCDIFVDASFTNALRLKDNNVSATRTVNLSGATKAFFSFSYRRKTIELQSGEDVLVQASSNGSTFTTIYTISGDGTTDANYVTVSNQDITSFASSATYIRFLTNNSVDDKDTVYIDDVSIRFLKYNQCYITKIDASTIPANTYITTVQQRTATFTAAGTCASLLDYGVAKNSITVSGNLYNDANALTDALVNGTAIGTPSGATVYAYLVDTLGRVAFKTTVNSGTGAFTFAQADVNTNYTLRLSTTNVAVFANAPANAGYASTWVCVGDAYGTNNGAGTGNRAGTAISAIPANTGLVNLTDVRFGIQRYPDSDPKMASIPHPYIDQFFTLNGGANPPVLSGTDPEDCSGGCLITNRSVRIDTVPDNSELYYNGILVTSNQLITNFDPSLLQVKVTDGAIGDSVIFFYYSFVDAGSLRDPSPAKYTLVWSWPLPAVGLIAEVNLYNNDATIKWSTLSEQNTDYFELESSLDNITFSSTGFKVNAASNSVTKQYYQQRDNISNLTQNPIIYYRVKLVDLDGKFKYSNIVFLKLSNKPGITVYPNPFHSNFTISITTEKETIIDVSLIDVSGRTIMKNSYSASKGIKNIAIDKLEYLSTGIYLLEVTDRKADTTYQKLLKK